MKTTITIEFDGDDGNAVANLTLGVDLGLLLRDALGEFVAQRTPAESYVAERYGYVASKAFKVRDVLKRCKLADVLKRGDVTVEVDETAGPVQLAEHGVQGPHPSKAPRKTSRIYDAPLSDSALTRARAHGRERLPLLLNCQGEDYYKPGWYRQAGDFYCDDGSVTGHRIPKGARVHIDLKGDMHCARHVKVKP